MLNNIPLIGISLGILLLLLVLLSNKGPIKNKRSKRILAVIILFQIHLQLDLFLYLHGLKQSLWVGYSHLHLHLYGALIYLFAVSLLKLEYSLRKWSVIIGIFTFCRIVLLIILDGVSSEADVFLKNDNLFFYALDYYAAIAFNILFLLKTLKETKRESFAINLTKAENINYNWLIYLIRASLLIYILIIASTLLAFFGQPLQLLQLRIENFITSLFFFAMSYFAWRYPVFSIHGDYEVLPETIKEKYAKSALSKPGSDALWEKINEAVVNKKAYLNSEFRLNDLATSVNESIHHVSQCINEQKQNSFSDYINLFRVEDAKSLLLSKDNSHYTILAIAYEAGFNSKTAFYNAFKKHTGVSPSQFKKMAAR